MPVLAAALAAFALLRLGLLAFAQHRLADKVPSWPALGAALPPTVLLVAAAARASAARLELGARERTRVALLLALRLSRSAARSPRPPRGRRSRR
ncbi:MAG: hypothetical protein IPQ09_30475 [Myxococcales bacterium]|nr:hypothetical protein [Myxococcales bacterium]